MFYCICGQLTNYRRGSGTAALEVALATSTWFPVYTTSAEEAGLIGSFRCGLNLYRHCKSLLTQIVNKEPVYRTGIVK